MTRAAATSDLLNLPNVLSLSRLGMAVAFVVMSGTVERVALIGAASLSDFLDGFIARRRHLETKWGALLDPVTDRFFVFTALCAYLFGGKLTTAEYFVVISRDLMTAVGFLVARSVSWLRPITFKARMSGKVTTALQLATLLAVLLAPRIVRPLVAAVGVASAVAIVDYTLMLWRNRAR